LLIGSFPFLSDDAFGGDRGSKADYRGNYANGEGPIGLKIGGGGPEHLTQTALASTKKRVSVFGKVRCVNKRPEHKDVQT
jgi:hypothetical protein